MARKYATADRVDLTGLLEFVTPRHHMVLTTFRADGSPQSSPVTGGVDTEGRLVIASYPQRAKSVNIQRTGRASALVLSDEFDGPYVQVDSAAEVIDLPEAVAPLVEYFRAVAAEPRLGRVPPCDGRSGQVPDPGRAATLGPGGHRRVPCAGLIR